MKTLISRRHALRALGACVFLPSLEAMGAPVVPRSGITPPRRLVWLFAGSGMYMPDYRPEATGTGWEWTPTLAPLEGFREEMSILGGLLHEGAFRRNPVIVRHGQDPMCHLTGADLGRLPGVAARNSVSIDQIAARRLGGATRLPHLAVGASGATITYSDNGSSIPAEGNPHRVFQRLFAGTTAADKEAAEARYRRNKSLLDDVRDETRRLNSVLGVNDREKMDEYLTRLREIETRMDSDRRWAEVPLPEIPAGVKPPPTQVPPRFSEHVRLLLDSVVLALQTDQTRIATGVIGHMGDVYPELGLRDGYHGYTHHGNQPDKIAAMAAIDRERIGHVAYFVEKLRGIREADGSTLLDHTLVHYGCGMGTYHESPDLPNLLLGGRALGFGHGDHRDYKQTPLANLYVTMLHAAGLKVDRFADSTGELSVG